MEGRGERGVDGAVWQLREEVTAGDWRDEEAGWEEADREGNP